MKRKEFQYISVLLKLNCQMFKNVNNDNNYKRRFHHKCH